MATGPCPHSATVPVNAGQFCWRTDVAAMFVWDGTTWQQLAVIVGSPVLNASTLAALPAAGTAGRLWRVTDSVSGVWMDTGTAWQLIGPTAFTAGSVPFTGTNGSLTQNNAALFWDNTNLRLALGTVTPVGKMDIRGAGFTGNSSGGGSGALSVLVSATGTKTGSALAMFEVTADDVNAAGNKFDALQVFYTIGGTNLQGGRHGISSQLNLTATTNAANADRNYVGVHGQAAASVADTGTDTGVNAKGAIFGANLIGWLKAGATNFLNVTGGEVNVIVETGASVRVKTLLQLSGHTNDRVSGAAVDAMLWFTQQLNAAAPKFSDGILFDNSAGNDFPVKTTGTIFRVSGGTYAKGIDLSAGTFTTADIKLRTSGTLTWTSGVVRSDATTTGPIVILADGGATVFQTSLGAESTRLGAENAGGWLRKAKLTAAAAAPGAGFGQLYWRAGTTVGTLKLIGIAGTSNIEVTIVDNVGAGN